ncbi:MAG: hypothetical protein Q7S14_03230 [bacterium]|nr:hypothetical protein [bacterium]
MKTDQWLSIGVVIILVLYLESRIINYWQADATYSLAQNLNRSGQPVMAFQKIQETITAVPDEPLYRDELSQVATTIALAAASENNASLAAQLANIATQSSNTAIADSPNNPTFWRTRAKVFYSLSITSTALEAILKAVDLAPTDAKVHYFAGLLLQANGKIPEAIKMLEETRNLKINYRDARFQLAKLYLENNQKYLAKQEAEFIINRIGNDEEVKMWVQENDL